MAAGGRASRPTAGPARSGLCCTKSRSGRTISVHRYEQILARARAEQADPAWAAAYRADRPIVERKISHFTRRAWGARKARTRGLKRVSTDLDTRAGALNWARLAILGLHLDAKRLGDRLRRDLERPPISPKTLIDDPFTTVENATTTGIGRTRKPRALLGGRRSEKAPSSAAS